MVVTNPQANRKSAIQLIFKKLSEYYGNSILRTGWRGNQSWWQANSSFELVVGSILVQNTNWRNVAKALDNFGNKLHPEYVLAKSDKELAEVIRPAGFQNQKAKKLKAFCEWYKTYNFNVDAVSQINKETLREELLSINSIGNETADALLVYVFGKTFFVIDAYTRRIFTRIGFDVPKNYDRFREMIEQAVPCRISTYDYYHGLMVEHAKEFCNKTPKCDTCPLTELCNKIAIKG